ncbi:MAG: AMP-binding protein, partial [Candidatus Aminicenantes bacterium]|nr:AMP-binding protein [Candidatus Aminicenantes bacterium]
MSELAEVLDKQAIEDILSLTPRQASMLNSYLKDTNSDDYVSQLSLNISGEIDINLFEKAWDFIVKNNEMLRTRLSHDKMKKPTQVVLKHFPVETRHHDFTGRSDDMQIAAGNTRDADRQEKFDPLQVPFRVTLCKITKDSFELIVSHHPVLFDSRSSGIILKEFFAAYHRLSSGMESTSTKKTKFKEYTKWIFSQDETRQKRYWKNYLLDIKTGTEISVKRGKGKESRTFGNFYKELGKDLRLKLKDFIRDNKTKVSRGSSQDADSFYDWGEICQTYSSVPPGNGLSLSTLFYTAFGILLQRYNNSSDVIFGTAVSGRTTKIENTGDIVGLFRNILPLRIHSESGEKTVDLIEKVNKALQKRVEYETASLDQIKKYSRFDKSEELFDTLLEIEHNPLDVDQIQGEGPLTVNSYSKFEMPAYDFTMVLTLSDNIDFRIIFNNEVFEKDTIERLASHFINILEDITGSSAKELSRIEMLSSPERRRLVYDFNRRETDFPTQRTIPQEFSDQVDKTPDHTAVVYNEEEVGYRELDDRSNVMARFLLEQGLVRCNMVGIMVDRSLELIVGILGILKAGGAYVPLNGKAPLARNRFIMAECNVKILLTGSDIREQTKVEGEIEYFEIHSTMLEDVSLIAGLPEEHKAKRDFSSSSTDINSSTYPPVNSTNASPEDLSEFQTLSSPEDFAYVIFTSGSTGTPKGIAVTHADLSPLLHWGYETLRIGTGDRTLQNLSVYFDWSVWEIFITLTTGAALYVAPNEVLRNSTACIDFMNANDITTFHVTPTQYRYIAAKGKKLPTLKYLFLGAEKLTYDLFERSLASV